MMSIPGLALFYGGLVRSKNMLSVLMQVFVIFSLIVVLWTVYGYSIAFTEGGAFFGGLTRLFLAGIFTVKDGVGLVRDGGDVQQGRRDSRVSLHRLPGDVRGDHRGAHRRRVRRADEVLARCCCSPCCGSRSPTCRSRTWCGSGPGRTASRTRPRSPPKRAKGGWLWQKGALDFAGGTVVHINAGVAGLVGAYVVGKRVGYGKDSMAPHNLTFTMIGASLLWVGWFGFNAGSALEAGDTAALAFINTLVATAAAVLSWMGAEWVTQGQAVDAGRCVGRGRRVSSRSRRPAVSSASAAP